MTSSEPDKRRKQAQPRRRAHLEACYRLSARLLEATTVEDVSEVTVEAVMEASGASASMLMIPYRFGDREEMLYDHSSPVTCDDLPEGFAPAVLEATLAQDGAVWEADPAAFLAGRGLPPAPALRSFISVPLRLGLIPVGAMLVCNLPFAQDLPRLAEELSQLVRPVAHAFSHCWFVRTSARDVHVLEAIQESAGNMLAYLDDDLRFVQVNSAFAQAAGRPRRELIGAALPEVLPQAQGLLDACHRVLATKEAESAEEAPNLLPPAPGEEAGYWNWRVTPILDQAEGSEGVVVSVQDVTAQVQAREQLVEVERARARLAESLTAELNHRIKNNLAMVAGLLRMQLQGVASEDPGAVLIHEAIQRLGALAAVHEQLSDSHLSEVEVGDVVRRVATNAGKTLKGEHVQVTVDGPVHCPARTATIVSVVTNELVTNALKHGSAEDGGPPAVQVNLWRDGGRLCLGVWNSGSLLAADSSPAAGRMGLRLVEELVSQCEGCFALTPQEGGVLAEVVLEEWRLTDQVTAS